MHLVFFLNGAECWCDTIPLISTFRLTLVVVARHKWIIDGFEDQNIEDLHLQCQWSKDFSLARFVCVCVCVIYQPTEMTMNPFNSSTRKQMPTQLI